MPQFISHSPTYPPPGHKTSYFQKPKFGGQIGLFRMCMVYFLNLKNYVSLKKDIGILKVIKRCSNGRVGLNTKNTDILNLHMIFYLCQTTPCA